MDADLDTLATALYVFTDDVLRDHPERVPPRPRGGIAPKLSDAELLTLAVLQALLGFTSEHRWIRYADAHLACGDVPATAATARLQQTAPPAGRHDGLADRWASSTTSGSSTTPSGVVDSTPVECGRERETAQRSDLAGWACYGYCASHSRFFWGFGGTVSCTLHGLPVGWAPDRRQGQRTPRPDRHPHRHPGPGRTARADPDRGTGLLRPRVRGRTRRRRDHPAPPDPRRGDHPGPANGLKPLRQIIESVNDTLKGQLDLERHGGRTIAGVCTRIAQRLLALTAAIWHNDRISQPSADP